MHFYIYNLDIIKMHLKKIFESIYNYLLARHYPAADIQTRFALQPFQHFLNGQLNGNDPKNHPAISCNLNYNNTTQTSTKKTCDFC